MFSDEDVWHRENILRTPYKNNYNKTSIDTKHRSESTITENKFMFPTYIHDNWYLKILSPPDIPDVWH